MAHSGQALVKYFLTEYKKHPPYTQRFMTRRDWAIEVKAANEILEELGGNLLDGQEVVKLWLTDGWARANRPSLTNCKMKLGELMTKVLHARAAALVDGEMIGERSTLSEPGQEMVGGRLDDRRTEAG